MNELLRIPRRAAGFKYPRIPAPAANSFSVRMPRSPYGQSIINAMLVELALFFESLPRETPAQRHHRLLGNSLGRVQRRGAARLTHGMNVFGAGERELKQVRGRIKQEVREAVVAWANGAEKIARKYAKRFGAEKAKLRGHFADNGTTRGPFRMDEKPRHIKRRKKAA